MRIAHQCRKRSASHAEGPKSFRGGFFGLVKWKMTHHFFNQETPSFAPKVLDAAAPVYSVLVRYEAPYRFEVP